ncbi:hypothetical protein UY3_17664 [Chelonia mydas]|uniref:Uncharacterized protein n=1 Tax=Chelonia mydas TaxID=8469 RepID=M7BAN0_CHEMY|nr:hypothetical protein UY3_17664 [Chelonia mydas]
MLPWLVRCVDPGPLLSPDMGSSPAWLWEGHSEHGARWCIALHSCGDISPAGACRRLDPGAFHTRFSPAATKSQVTKTRALQFAAITAHGTDSSLQVLGVSPGRCPPGTWGIEQSKLDPPCPRCHQHGANRQLPSLLGILRLPGLPVSSPGAGSEALGLQDSQPPHTQLPPTLSDGLLGAT